MTKIYSLVQLAKAKQGITSDNAFAIQNGFTRAHINNWKAGLASPSAVNYLKLAKAAGLDIDQALSYIEEETKKKEAGFATLPMLGLLGAGSFGAMSLLNVTPLSNGMIPLGVFATFATLYTLYEVEAIIKKRCCRHGNQAPVSAAHNQLKQWLSPKCHYDLSIHPSYGLRWLLLSILDLGQPVS